MSESSDITSGRGGNVTTQNVTGDRRVDETDPLAAIYSRIHGSPAKTQATVIEQTRAATQVTAAILAAKNWPRDEVLAEQKMRLACDQLQLADRAFWSFPRGRDTISGMTVQMARALLAIWGNAMADVVELFHDDQAESTEMRAYAVDLETNVTFARTFTVKHRIEASGRTKQLTTDRDIYENNANLGARRLRECIFDLLPGWFKDEAGEIARLRLQNPDPTKSPAQLAADAIKWLTDHGISLRRIEARLRKPRGEWDAYDLGQLRVLMGTMHRGEAPAVELFPDVGVTAEEIRGAQSVSKTSEPDPSSGASSEAAPQGGVQQRTAGKRSAKPEETP